MKMRTRLSRSYVVFIFTLMLLFVSAAFSNSAEALRARPDLIVSSVGLTSDNWIQITLKNIGPGPIPLSQFNSASVGLIEGNSVRGSYALHVIDPDKNLMRPGGSATFIWSSIILRPGTHRLGAIVDITNAVDETREDNNRFEPRTFVVKAKPDLGLYGYMKIGKRKKQVDWNRTVTLTPEDVLLVSGGKVAFDIYYGYREYNGGPASGFKNKLYFNSSVVSIQSNLSLRPKEIRHVATQAYLGPGDGRLCLKIDADDNVHETREDNNYGCINVVFSGFDANGTGSIIHPPIGKVKNIPRKPPRFVLPNEKVKAGVPR